MEAVRDAAKLAAIASGVPYVDPFAAQLTPAQQMANNMQVQKATNIANSAKRAAKIEKDRDAAKLAAIAAGVPYVDPHAKLSYTIPLNPMQASLVGAMSLIRTARVSSGGSNASTGSNISNGSWIP
jgi:hypothetical protein